MNALQALPQFLTAALRQDPTLALAHAAVWLDPFRFCPADVLDDVLYYADTDDEAALMVALGIARDCFPAIYVETLRRIRLGCSFKEISDFYRAALAEIHPHIALCCLQDMVYGVPCQWAGVDPLLPEFLAEHPDLAALLQGFFGIAPRRHDAGFSRASRHFSAADIEMACKIAAPITRSLIREMHQPCADLAFLLMWLFATSGNSLVDHSQESYYESGYDSVEWEPDTLELVDKAHAQAAIVLSAARRGLERLQTDDEVAEALRQNITLVKAALEREDTHVSITWPRWAETGASGGADADAALVLLRSCYAPED